MCISEIPKALKEYPKSLKVSRKVKFKNLRKMKKLFLVLVFALFSITAINAEETENKSNNEATTETSINAPVYWQGWAQKINYSRKLYLTVYQSNGMCNSYYAIASKVNDFGNIKNIEPVELVVKEGRSGDYYVTYDGIDYSFSM